MGFLIYDLVFLAVFSIIICIILWNKRDGLKRESAFLIYRTKVGMNAIDYFGEKYSKVLNSLKYFVICVGCFLMIIATYLIGSSIYNYIKIPEITKVIKAPPIAPLIPYFPKLFGMEGFFPSFYFTYFIVALGIVALSHEFFHGIFMKVFKIKIKSTGFVFLGPFFGAFVEQDDEQMRSKKNHEQMTVLAGGTFANLIISIISLLLLIGFFYMCFSPAGYIFNGYAMKSVTNISAGSIISSEIMQVNLIQNITKITTNNGTYYTPTEFYKIELEVGNGTIKVYEGTPAVNAELEGVIIEADGKKIINQQDIDEVLSRKIPGDDILLKTRINNEIKEYKLKLDSHPLNDSKAFIGIGYYKGTPTGIIGKTISKIASFKDSSTFYEPKFDGDFVWFFYYLIWWVALINILVALFNMLPIGFLDGGRFFYLGVLSITKSEKFAKITSRIMLFIILTGFALMTLVWLVRIL